ncbi:hypothetical protein Agub_g14038 [Astrephomene gubernaculifera]|uniref:Condensin complex subunit 1 C-terminal domain-containing protein n=1 Tax=Astrephomene gubernaculifera TaxID=47775 RepID=A0AAD3E341_9CHLO|nr:hypothetical protein Agub_g14038 [Astrephomene gubernaculifera]
MTNVAATLAQLTEVANGELAGQLAEDALVEAAEAVQELRAEAGWAALQGEDLSAVALTRALGDILKLQDASLRSRAATVYGTLLSLPDAPVGTLCEPYAFVGFVHCLKSLCLPAKQQQAGDGVQQQDAAAEPAASPLALLEDLGSFLKQHDMRSSPEMFTMLLEALVDMTGSGLSSEAQGKPGKAGKRGGGARNQGGASVAEAAFSLLPVMVDSRHGDVVQTMAVLCHRLVPSMVGSEGARRGGHGMDRRSAALGLVNELLSTYTAAKPCLLALMRELCLRAPDKADSRQLAVAAVQALLPNCTPDDVHKFCLFLHRLSRTHKTSNRMVAVELAGALLSALPAPFAATGSYQRIMDGSCGAGDELDAPWSALCLGIVVARSNDKSASVRCKAMACLADCAQSFANLLRVASSGGGGQEAAGAAAFVPALCASRCIRVQVTEPRKPGSAGGEGDDEDGDEEMGEGEGPQAFPPPEAKVTATIPGKPSMDLSWMTVMCHDRCRDDKAAVRKAALLLLEAVMELCAAAAHAPAADGAGGQPAFEPTAQDVQVLEDATADSLVSVRKAALQVVCSLVSCYPHHAGLAGVWARCVLPMIRDPESAVQDTVLDRLSALLLDPVATLAKGAGGRGGAGRGAGAAAAAQAEVQHRLAALAQMGRAASSCLGKALGMLSAKKLLRGPQVAAGLEVFLTAAANEAAAEEPMQAAPRARNQRDPAAVAEAEQARQRRRELRDQREGAWMLLVEVAGQDPAAPSWQFLQRCWGELQAAGAGASAQEGAMLLWVISHAASRFPAADATNLAAGLLQAILGFNLPCAAVAAHLAALLKLTQAEGGQAVVGAPAQWCARVLEAAEEVLGQAMEARGNLTPVLATRCQLALFTLGEVALLRETKMPGGVPVKVQALTHARAGGVGGSAVGASGTAVAQARAPQAFSAVSAHAWTCLGKLCIADESLAKKCVPLLVQEMSGSPSPVIRNNLLVGLSDMVVQFTGLADAYVGRLAAMVRDPHELVRRQALALLANLLLRDFVKWRGALVHRFLLALVDESPGVRQLAQYLLSDSLAAKAPMLAYNHFIESLFVLNDCSAGVHASRAGGGSSELAAELALHSALEGGGFHLKGATPVMRAKRDIIYTALLRRMSPEQRFSAGAKLVAEVLSGVVDGLLPLGEAEEVLGDALRLLACKDMKVNANRFGASADDDGMDQGTQDDASKARGKLVGAMMRKHLTEHVIPAMVELRYMLQAQKHPLLGSLMLCMASLLRDYKSEVEDIIVCDRQLAREIMHDLKHYETLAKQQQQQQEAAMAAALAGGGQAANRGANATAAPAVAPAAAPAMSGQAATGPHHAEAQAASSEGTLARMPPPPPPVPGDRQRRKTAVLPGVEPGRTPLAAELLESAANNRLNGPSLTPAGAAAAAKTPIAGLFGGDPAVALRTPITGLLGTAQRAGRAAAGGIPFLSPAPLSAKARAMQQQHRQQGGMTPAPSLGPARGRPPIPPAAAAGAAAAAAPAAADPNVRVTVVLPSPVPGAVRPLGLHNLAGSQAVVPAQLQQEAPAADAAAGGKPRSSRRGAAAGAMADDEENEHPDDGVDDAAGEKQHAGTGGGVASRQEAKEVAEGARPRRGAAKAGGGVQVKQEAASVKREAAAEGVLGPAAAQAAPAGRSRASKRRHD